MVPRLIKSYFEAQKYKIERKRERGFRKLGANINMVTLLTLQHRQIDFWKKKMEISQKQIKESSSFKFCHKTLSIDVIFHKNFCIISIPSGTVKDKK